MNNSSRTVLGISGVVLAFALFAGQAQAVQITGSISFGMSGVAANAGGPLPNFTGATMIDFADATPNGSVQSSSGDFATAGFTFLTPVTFYDLDFGTPGLPLAPLWTGTSGPNTASFDLLALTIDGQTANTLDLSGSGVLKLTGYEDTPASWTLSGDITTGSVVFGLSSTNTANPVPEPSILALLGLGLLGFAGRRKS